ncbi:MAG: ATP-binding protein [Lactobacillaceae bacterium]|nr:ATP-binding protein [Lactobacillaceae bacterium]
MRNRPKTKTVIFMLGAIIFYALIWGMSNHFVRSEQRQQLVGLGSEYRTALTTKTVKKQTASWQRDFSAQVVALPANGNSELAKIARNVADHNLVNSGAPFTKVQYQNKDYLLYLVSAPISKKSQAVLLQPLRRVSQNYALIWWSFSFLYWLLVALFIWLAFLKAKDQRQKLALMAANVQATGAQAEAEPILLTPDDPFFELENRLKDLHHFVTTELADAQLHEQGLRSLINNLPLGVMLLNQAGQVEMVNRALGTILDVPIAAKPGLDDTYVDYVKTYALSRMIEHALRQPQVKRHQRRDIQLVGDEGRFVEADVITLVGSPDHNEADMKVLVMLFDLTEIKQNEQMQLDFVANASHELRTPVTAISGYAETLLAGAQDDPQRRQEFLTTILEQAQHLEALIQDILQLSRADQAMPIRWQSINLDHLLQQELQLAAPAIKQRQLTVAVDTKHYHGPTLSDQLKLEEILKNLITNAVRYNVAGGKINVRLATDATQTTMIVSDTGIGLTTEDQTRIFERFYRVDQAHSHYQTGTGLGLAIVANLVDQLGGSITVRSQLGVGSTFTVKLPLNHIA